MPVWHERTQPWRDSGRLVVIGITQEQHPERCALFAQWQGFDWPILWDPFNLTGAAAVPGLFAIDEHGVVRSTRPRPDTFESEFLDARFDPPASYPTEPLADPLADPLAVTRARLADDSVPPADRACGLLLFEGESELDRAISLLDAVQDPRPADLFRLGVALRMRADSNAARPSDFQGAIDAWSGALARNPNQYIWRRRLQQYGPRLDKPYPFYDWVARANEEIRARGEEPIALRATLTGSEVASGLRAFEAGDPVDEPDPEGTIDRDDGELIGVEVAVTFHTSSKSGEGPPARVHLGLRPNPESDAHWNNEGEPLAVWVEIPAGWQADRQLLVLDNPPSETSNEVRRLDFELRPPAEASGEQTLRGYALFNACRGGDGTCLYRRRDFTVELVVP